MTSSLIGKFIIMDREEYEVEESLGTGYFYKIRNINTDREERASVEFINKKVATYEEDLKTFENKNNNDDTAKILLCMRIQNEAEIKNVKNTLVQRMKSLSMIINNAIDYIEDCDKKGIDYEVNSFGIVQGSGSEIDVLCSKLTTLENIKKNLYEVISVD